MTIKDIESEIAHLRAEIDEHSRQIILANGAIQAFEYVKRQLALAEQQVNTDVADEVARQVLDARAGADHEC